MAAALATDFLKAFLSLSFVLSFLWLKRPKDSIKRKPLIVRIVEKLERRRRRRRANDKISKTIFLNLFIRRRKAGRHL